MNIILKQYTTLTQRLIQLAKQVDPILADIEKWHYHDYISPNKNEINDAIVSSLKKWQADVETELELNEMTLEKMKFANILHGHFPYIAPPIPDIATLLKQKEVIKLGKEKILDICLKLESLNETKNITQIFIDDIDNFKEILKGIKPTDIDEKYCKAWFLEDTVEEEFRKTLGEPYKENDGGAETRDLFTDKITIDGKRHTAVFMFKGRGIKVPLNNNNCGKNGTQLLRLAKNSFIQLYIIQHVHKIEPEVVETLRDHILAHSLTHNIKICVIDGTETARFLKGKKRDLDKLGSTKK